MGGGEDPTISFGDGGISVTIYFGGDVGGTPISFGGSGDSACDGNSSVCSDDGGW